jgi:hypothetical protein
MQHVSGILMPVIRSSITAVAASGLPLERGDSSVVGRTRADHPDDDQHTPPSVGILWTSDRPVVKTST